MSSPRSLGQTRALPPLGSPNGKSWPHRREGITLVSHRWVLLMAVELVIGEGAKSARAVCAVGVVGQNRSFEAVGKGGEDEVGFGSSRGLDRGPGSDWERSLSLKSACIDDDPGLGEGFLAGSVRKGLHVGGRSIPGREQGWDWD